MYIIIIISHPSNSNDGEIVGYFQNRTVFLVNEDSWDFWQIEVFPEGRALGVSYGITLFLKSYLDIVLCNLVMQFTLKY
jgi:hypothetical protein